MREQKKVPTLRYGFYGCFYAYVGFCLYGTAVCAVLGGVALIVRYSVPIGFLVLLSGVAALWLIHVLDKWLRVQEKAIVYVIGIVFILLIAFSMIGIQSHFYPQ